jgi:hypothetical protein
MAIASYASYLSKARNPYQKIGFGKISGTQVAGVLYSDWLASPNVGGAYTSPVACDRNTVGALGNGRRPISNASSTTQRISRFSHCHSSSANTHIIYDRLTQMSGLSGIVTGAQTTNLPTAALPRYTSGSGVVAWIEHLANTGAGATTITISYTNQAGVAGRTSPAMFFGSTTAIRACQIIALQAGDTGVRSVESVNVAASTGTAGNFGITLGKILGIYYDWYSATRHADLDAIGNLGMTFPRVQPDACLALLESASASGLTRSGTFDLIQE